ncbi:MAG: site-specific recombinase [Thermoanaerobacteraceae bacterium]|nr:site-specific recombinase [Thermoanaerobacteraceae bacterium]
MDKKRVVCLYRVSTKGQVDPTGDISMQEKACREFIAQRPDWEFLYAYSEKGVSGFTKSIDEREALQIIKQDAYNKKFDVLLVFMFDRIGRREGETYLFIEELGKAGIEIWSVREGQMGLKTPEDRLMNFIRYWGAGKESRDTSHRVSEKHKQMTEEGKYRGGLAPYGYKLVYSGNVNKKGKPLKKLAIDEEEAEVVKLVYDLALNYGMGGHRIAKYLNEHGIKPRKSDEWNSAVINYMLRHPIYKGYLNCGKTKRKEGKHRRVSPKEWVLSEKPLEELIIIPEDIWNQVQVVRNSRTPEKYRLDNLDYSQYPLQTKSPLLFTGFIYCGSCGSKLSTGYVKHEWTTKDGKTHKKSRNVYKCIRKTSGGTKCTGRCIYYPETIEGPVLNEIYQYLETLKNLDLSQEIDRIIKQNLQSSEKRIKELKETIAKNEKYLAALKEEVPKSILGESQFSPEILNESIRDTADKLEKAYKELEEAQKEYERYKLELDDIIKMQKTVPYWREELEKAPTEVKKMILSKIIDKIVVYSNKGEKNCSIEIELNIEIEAFLKLAEGKNKEPNDLHEQNILKRRFPGLEEFERRRHIR